MRAATSATGRAMEQPYEFTFATPAVRLLEAEWYRRAAASTVPPCWSLRFNQPVRPADVLAHASVAATPHAWKPPQLSLEARERLRQTDPAGLSRFDDKVACGSTRDILVWTRSRHPACRVVGRIAIPARSRSRRARDDDRAAAGHLVDDRARRHAAEPARATDAIAQSTVVQLEPTFFVQRMSCEGVCGPSRYNAVALTRPVALDGFAEALTVADVTDPGAERPVSPGPRFGRAGDNAAEVVTSAPAMHELGFGQPPTRIWRVELARDLQAADGQTLGYPWIAFVEHMHMMPFVGFDGSVWEAGGAPAGGRLPRPAPSAPRGRRR